MDGILNIYKEKGYTSHDVVAKLRGILRQKKIGHTGTLDPEAEGVLPVCVGKATKVCDLLTDKNKTYRAVLLLGRVTDTQDLTGTLLRESPVTCTEEDVRRCIAGFVGEQEQIPPMYSAIRVNGKKLYELARKGIEVERAARKITIYEITVERLELPEVELTVHCSKGTYIRTLCSDIGERLGCGGCMKSLLRTQAGPFLLKDSLRLGEIEAARDEGRLHQIVWDTDEVFLKLPGVLLTPEAERLVQNGNPLSPELLRSCTKLVPFERPGKKAGNAPGNVAVAGMVREQSRKTDAENRQDQNAFATEAPESSDNRQLRIYGPSGMFLAIYGYSPTKRSWRAVKMF